MLLTGNVIRKELGLIGGNWMNQKNEWSTVQSAERMNIERHFEYDNYAMDMFRKWMPFLLKPSLKMMEVGSGGGFFTNLLLTINPQMNLTCLEPDPELAGNLASRFEDRVSVLPSRVEQIPMKSSVYDVVLSHIVLHNLNNPLAALDEMTRVTKAGGHVVAIEPLPASRHYFPTPELQQAFDLLQKAQVYRCMEWSSTREVASPRDPWSYCYPQLFEQVALKDIHCFGWTSVFTLSDSRFSFTDRKRWAGRRAKLIENEQSSTSEILKRNGHTQNEIDQASSIIHSYCERVDRIS
ncbi:MAG: class I SAM-dependent methyltransferase, partial [Candidatus Hodarchaeota archaeon]